MHTLAPHSAEQRLRLLQTIASRLTAEMSLRQILTGVGGIVRDAFGWDYVGCASVDTDAGVVRWEAHALNGMPAVELDTVQPIGDGIVGQVAWNGRPLRVDDVHAHPGYIDTLVRTRSELCVPVLYQGEVIAVLDAQSDRRAAFSDHDTATLSLIAELLAGSMAAARQLEAARQRADAIALLADVSRAMLREDELDAMLQCLIDELHSRFNLTLSTLCLVGGDAGALVLRAFAGTSSYPLRLGEPWTRDRGITGRALRQSRRIFVPDVRRDPDYIEGNAASVAELVVPIRFRGEPLGLINLESATPASFSPANQLAVQALADQAAGAIRLAMTKQRLEQVNAAAAVVTDELASMNRSLERANRRLREMNLRDPLTALGNRRRFDRGLRDAWQACHREGQPIALLLLDIDHYKAYNDLYGHAEGDRCLRRVGRAIRQTVRARDAVAARYGGEEFAIVLPNADRARAAVLAERLHAAMAALALPHAASPTAPTLTLSIGITAEVPQRPREPVDLIRAADAALYIAKRDGRARTAVA